MKDFFYRVSGLKQGMSTNAFAKYLGVNQKSLDQMLKGERKPSIQMVITICRKCHVSADWLLGLPEHAGHAVSAVHSAVAVNGNATNNGCAHCELLKAATAALTKKKKRKDNP